MSSLFCLNNNEKMQKGKVSIFYGQVNAATQLLIIHNLHFFVEHFMFFFLGDESSKGLDLGWG